jgi:hypothetical protein
LTILNVNPIKNITGFFAPEYNIFNGTSLNGNHLDDPGVDGRIILRWIFRKWFVSVWTGSIWLTYLLTPWSRVLLEKITSELCS